MAYPFPWDRFLGLACDLPSGRRSLRAEALALSGRIEPPPSIEGIDNLPRQGGVIIAANHYQRRGLWIAWAAAVVTQAVGERRNGDPPVVWLSTGGLRLKQWALAGPEIPLTRRLFGRIAATYGIVSLPLSNVSRRGAALHAWLRRASAGEVLGIFPEGLAGRSDTLRPPEEGFSSLCRIAGAKRIPIVPCGIFEEADRLCVRFGEIRLVTTSHQRIADEVMEGIALLLPRHLRGGYAECEPGQVSGAVD